MTGALAPETGWREAALWESGRCSDGLRPTSPDVVRRG